MGFRGPSRHPRDLHLDLPGHSQLDGISAGQQRQIFWRKLGVTRASVLAASLLLVAGCAMLTPPDQRDVSYPPHWPNISTVDVKINDFDGTYVNQGTVIDSKGNTAPIQLTGMLTKVRTVETVVPLRAVITSGKPPHTAFAKLYIGFEEGNNRREKPVRCFSIKHALLFQRVQSSSIDVPYLYSANSQRSVWLMKARDGSLVAKIRDTDSGLILLIPYYVSSYEWPIFPRAALQPHLANSGDICRYPPR